jgi:protocatechuate 3,4-dioxygenase alpha subunit
MEPTPSQTVGPFFHLGCTQHRSVGVLTSPQTQGERIKLTCRVFDGDGMPVPDAMIEIWQANAEGKYNHPDDTQKKSVDPAFQGFGRLATDGTGACTFETIMPGRVEADGNTLQAPHISVSVFARGILKRLATRIYFAGHSANGEDLVLGLVPVERRETLLAHKGNDRDWNFEIYLCGERETVFFDV